MSCLVYIGGVADVVDVSASLQEGSASWYGLPEETAGVYSDLERLPASRQQLLRPYPVAEANWSEPYWW
jgi:hypothetical protein